MEQDVENRNSVADVINRLFVQDSQNPIKHIIFPDFQRPYCWSVNDIQKILDDIDELRYSPEEERYREEDAYYLGPICFKLDDDPATQGVVGEQTSTCERNAELLDGQ